VLLRRLTACTASYTLALRGAEYAAFPEVRILLCTPACLLIIGQALKDLVRQLQDRPAADPGPDEQTNRD
jgi:hypothetical protein